MTNTARRHAKIRPATIQQWRAIINLLSDVMQVPVALMMRYRHDRLSVLIKNDSADNPYQPGSSEKCSASGLSCETVIKTAGRLFVSNALEDEHWKNNPDVKLEMINYLGYPLAWPNGDPFGTICVLDRYSHYYSEVQDRIMVQLKAMIEANLEVLENNVELKRLNNRLKALANTDELTGVLNRRAFLHSVKPSFRGLSVAGMR